MSFISYLKASFQRKKARRIFQNYGWRIDNFNLPEDGKVEYANWLNPLVVPKTITQHEVNFFKKITNSNSLVIDIGANTGDLTVPMAIAAGKNSLVLGLDPNPQVFAVLEANAKLNKDKSNIVPLPFAATETDSEFYFASSEASFSNGALIDTADNNSHGKHKLEQKVKGVNLEKHLKQHFAEWLPKLSFIKVDTEGHDLSVLKTLQTLIKEYKPTIIAEVFPTLTLEDRNAMYEFLHQFGYFIYDISHFDLTKEIEPVLLKSMQDMAKPGTGSNVLATPREWVK